MPFSKADNKGKVSDRVALLMVIQTPANSSDCYNSVSKDMTHGAYCPQRIYTIYKQT